MAHGFQDQRGEMMDQEEGYETDAAGTFKG
jgi:hypothetical protein